MTGPARHLLSIDDLSTGDIREIVEAGARYARRGPDPRALAGSVAGIHFVRTSTRTRTAFSAGAARLGAAIVTYGPNDLQTATGETVEDTGAVLSRMLDLVVTRTAGPLEQMRGWAAQERMSVINAMSAEEHPTQALADLTTLWHRFGRIDGLRILYLGEGNNTAAALAPALARFEGVLLDLRTPPGFGLDPAVLKRAAETAHATGATIVERHDLDDLPRDVDVVYTTRWQTTGTTKPVPNWRDVFAPFRVDARLWRHSPDAVFMHDLPAHRGEEVTAEVLDGPASIAFDQAEMKMHSAMAVMAWCRRVGTAPAAA
jgi:ornithine carbamoyltransferase